VIAGAVVAIPAIATTVWSLGKLGCGDPELPLLKAIRVTALFVGIAAIVTAGGVGRLAAQAANDDGASRKRPLWVAGRAYAAAGAALTIIAAIPHGHLPDAWPGFVLIGVAGAITGALCGVVIGAACGGAAPLALTDVMALARWPTSALRALLEPEDMAAATRTGPRRRRITIPFLFPAREAAPTPAVPTSTTPAPAPVAAAPASAAAAASTAAAPPPSDPSPRGSRDR
jgi:hypothetical protein